MNKPTTPPILTFAPDLHSVIWGGTAIAPFKGIDCDATDVGESWEVSAVPGKASTVASGPLEGQLLTDVVEQYGTALLGEHVAKMYDNKFPLLVKIIDANRDLSVQVHPDDALARQRHGSLGKTEMWYIIGTRPGARILIGLKEQLDPESYTRRVDEGTFASAIDSYESHPGDSFFIPAGRVHAIGAGNLLAEIQESSDITYRIYDYDRRDANGNPRTLHTTEARDAIDYTVHADYRNTPVRIDDHIERVAECSHFTVDVIELDGEQTLTACDSFMVVMCLDGEVTLSAGDTGAMTLRRGHTALIPAALMSAARATGHATLLTATA